MAGLDNCTNYEKALGRARGALASAKEDVFVDSFAKRRQIIEQANNERIKQWRQVSMGTAPDGPPPVMPEFLEGPSKLGLGLQLAGAALTAASPLLKVPGGGQTPPATPNPTDGLNIDMVGQYAQTSFDPYALPTP